MVFNLCHRETPNKVWPLNKCTETCKLEAALVKMFLLKFILIENDLDKMKMPIISHNFQINIKLLL